MKKQLAVVVLLALTSLAQAEMTSFTHDFHALYTADPRKITFADSYHTGTTNSTAHDLVYSCAGTAVFTYETVNPAGSRKISISMSSTTAVATTTTAIENLKQVEITRLPVGSTKNIQIQVSEYADFRTIITNDTIIYYTSGVVEARFPKGTYYVRLVKTNNTNLFVTSVIYYQEPCHCLRVVSE